MLQVNTIFLFILSNYAHGLLLGLLILLKLSCIMSEIMPYFLFPTNAKTHCIPKHPEYIIWTLSYSLHKCTGCSALHFHTRLQNGITPKIACYVVDSVVLTGHTALPLSFVCPCDSVKVISIDGLCDGAKWAVIGGLPIVHSLTTRKEEPFQ